MNGCEQGMKQEREDPRNTTKQLCCSVHNNPQTLQCLGVGGGKRCSMQLEGCNLDPQGSRARPSYLL